MDNPTPSARRRKSRTKLDSPAEQSTGNGDRLLLRLRSVAVVTFLGTIAALLLLDALGLGDPGARTDLAVIGVLVGAVLTLLGVEGIAMLARR